MRNVKTSPSRSRQPTSLSNERSDQLKLTTFRNGVLISATACILVGLTGCSGREENVRLELKVLTQDVKSKIKPLPAAVIYDVIDYKVEALADPFSPAKIVQRAAGSQPDTKRIKEALEAYPLESVRMVGTVLSGGVLHAALSVDGFLFKIRPGQYVGQNYGKVIRINATSIDIKELVQESNGDWTETPTQLSMQDSTEVKSK